MDKKKASRITKKYVDFLRKKNPGIKKVYLFGSYAKGIINVDSDIDLAIVFENLTDTFDMQVELMKLRRKFDNRIEPHAFRESDFEVSNPLAMEILKTGIEIIWPGYFMVLFPIRKNKKNLCALCLSRGIAPQEHPKGFNWGGFNRGG
jgi:predicted nucleotidyltransferase